MPVDSVRLTFQEGGVGLLNAIIGLVMFGVALDLHARDFLRIVHRPKGPLIGLFSLVFLMPAMSFLLTLVLKPSPSVALGMLLVAACPGGNLSNFLTLLAKGNAAMSVTMTALSTMTSVIVTPLNLALWGSLNPATAQLLKEIHLDPVDLFQTVLVILGIPTLLGMLFARFAPSVATRLHAPFKVFSLVVFIGFVAVAFAQNVDVFKNHIHAVFMVVLLQNAAALALGYFAAAVIGLPEADRRAVAIEVGIHNSALGIALVFRYFDGLGGMALVAGWWGIWHCVTGLGLASWWARRPPENAAES